jgi:hypothetical protein
MDPGSYYIMTYGSDDESEGEEDEYEDDDEIEVLFFICVGTFVSFHCILFRKNTVKLFSRNRTRPSRKRKHRTRTMFDDTSCVRD